MPFEAIAKVKDAGNTAYKAGGPENWTAAVKKYTKAIRYITYKREGSDVVGDAVPEISAEMASLEATCYLNRAQVYLKLGDVHRKNAVSDTSAVLKLKGVTAAQMVKAYYRRSQASTNDDEKEDDLRAALKLDPNNSAAKRDLAVVKKKHAVKLEAQRKAYSKMFS